MLGFGLLSEKMSGQEVRWRRFEGGKVGAGELELLEIWLRENWEMIDRERIVLS